MELQVNKLLIKSQQTIAIIEILYFWLVLFKLDEGNDTLGNDHPSTILSMNNYNIFLKEKEDRLAKNKIPKRKVVNRR